jgi:hypothetical protein
MLERLIFLGNLMPLIFLLRRLIRGLDGLLHLILLPTYPHPIHLLQPNLQKTPTKLSGKFPDSPQSSIHNLKKLHYTTAKKSP